MSCKGTLPVSHTGYRTIWLVDTTHRVSTTSKLNRTLQNKKEMWFHQERMWLQATVGYAFGPELEQGNGVSWELLARIKESIN